MAPPVLPAYAKDERVLCFHHELLYEAKVLDYKHTEPNDKKTPLLYLVHYKGWKKTWDDWVPQDRLRKFTEENKELAQDLKREMDDSRARAAPKSASLKKKNAGSDFSSARGSEERHSSLPVTGRGSKRGRDPEIEKVGDYYFISSPGPCPDLDYDATTFGGSEASMYDTDSEIEPDLFIACYDGTGDQPLRRSGRKPVAKTHFDSRPTPVPPTPKSKRKSKAATPVPKKGLAQSAPGMVEQQAGSLTTEVPASEQKTTLTAKKNDSAASNPILPPIEVKIGSPISDVPPPKENTALIERNENSSESSGPAFTSAEGTDHTSVDKPLPSTSTDRNLDSTSNMPAPYENVALVEDEGDSSVTSTLAPTSTKGEDNTGKPLASASTDEISSSPTNKSQAPKENVGLVEDKGGSTISGNLAPNSTEAEVDTGKSLAPTSTDGNPSSPTSNPQAAQENATSVADTGNSFPNSFMAPTPSEGPVSSSRSGSPVSKGLPQEVKEKEAALTSVTSSVTDTQPPAVSSTTTPSMTQTSVTSIAPDALSLSMTTSATTTVEQPPVIATMGSLQESNAADGSSSSSLTPPPPSGGESAPSPPTPATKPGGRKPAAKGKAKVTNSRIAKAKPAPKAKTSPRGSKSASASPPRPTNTEEALTMEPPKCPRLINPPPREPRQLSRREQDNQLRIDEATKRGAPCKKAPIYLHEHNRFLEDWGHHYFYAGMPADMPKRPRERMGPPKVAPERLRWMKFRKEEIANGTPRDEINSKYLAILASEKEASILESSGSDSSTSQTSSGSKKRKAVELEESSVKDHATQAKEPKEANAQAKKTQELKDQPVQGTQEAQAPPAKRNKTKKFTVNHEHLTQEEIFHTRPAVRLPISDHLKALLVDDWENVTKNLSLVPVPAEHPVNEILSHYYEEEKTKRRVGSAEMDLLEEIVAGVREYFNQCLGRILLYRFEREQYFEVRKKWEGGDKEWDGKGPADAYGAEHLCRLFVSMPELIAQTNMDQQSVNRLREELAKMTQWLGKHSQNYFTAEYEVQSQEYIDKARGTFLH